MNSKLDKYINSIFNEIGSKNPVVVKKFYIGKVNILDAAIIYVNGLVNKDIIDRDILHPLMLHVDENVLRETTAEYICKKYIPMSNTDIMTNLTQAAEAIKTGKTVLIIEEVEGFIIIDTIGGNYRSITDPPTESAIRGSREGFVENIETNISMLRRRIKDQNLAIEKYKVGNRSKTDVALMYIADIVDKDILIQVRDRINSIDVDFISGTIEQFIEDSPYSIFPQVYGTERPDIVNANIMEGRIAILLNGNAYVLTVPAIFIEFFQAVEDYNQRTIVASFARLLRIIAVFIVITLPSIYLSLVNYNVELIPVKFVNPIVQSREGIALTPFLEILILEIVVEFLREGGLRLPPRIASTLSIVGGIIIGEAAVESKIASPTTLLIIGISVVASFLIPNYEMSLSIRFLRFPMLIIANAMGFLGIAAGCFFLVVHLFSLESVSVPYISINHNDLKDTFIRAQLWKMNKRPESIPNKNPLRQRDFRKLWRKKDE